MDILKILTTYFKIRLSNCSRESRVRALRRLYRDVDVQIGRFKRATGLQCVQGCGTCCENPKIETTVLELIPAAEKLFRHGQAFAWHQKALDSRPSSVCLFYQKDPSRRGAGHCGIYSLRPLICRLYGFSAVNNKYGQPVLVTCPAIKNSQEKKYRQVRQKVRRDLAVPRMPDFIQRLGVIDMALGVKQYPVNEAIRLAIERVGLKQGYEHSVKRRGSATVFSKKHPRSKAAQKEALLL